MLDAEEADRQAKIVAKRKEKAVEQKKYDGILERLEFYQIKKQLQQEALSTPKAGSKTGKGVGDVTEQDVEETEKAIRDT